MLLEELVDAKYDYLVTSQKLAALAADKSSLKAQWTAHGVDVLRRKLAPKLKVWTLSGHVVQAKATACGGEVA